MGSDQISLDTVDVSQVFTDSEASDQESTLADSSVQFSPKTSANTTISPLHKIFALETNTTLPIELIVDVAMIDALSTTTNDAFADASPEQFMLPEDNLSLIASDDNVPLQDIEPVDATTLAPLAETVAVQFIDALKEKVFSPKAETLADALTEAEPNSSSASPSAYPYSQ